MVDRKRSRSRARSANGKQKARFKSGEVKITVNYGYDIHSLVISGRTWNRIRKGKAVVVRGQGFWWEGRSDQDRWHFHGDSQESIEVRTDDGGEVYLGSLRDGNVWVDVDGKEVNFDEHLGPKVALDEELLRAYQSTEYRVPDKGFVLRVGVKCPEVVALHGAHGVATSAFITAWNPGSKKLDGATNQRRNTLLAEDIAALGLSCVDGEGVGVDAWSELSYLVVGATRKQAHALAYAYGQNAFLFVGATGVPQLVVVERGGDVMEMVVQPNGRIVVAGFEPPPPDTPQEEFDRMPGDALEAAFKCLYLEPLEELNAVGVLLIEGDSPMSDTCYAVLDVSPAVANLAAASRGLPYRFRVD